MLRQNGAKKEKQKVRNIIQACFFLENQEKQDHQGQGGRKSLRTLEKNIYIEELRHERIQKTIEAVRELEYSNPDKIK